jgi:hypothetical protein
MQKTPRLVGLLTALFVGLLVAVSVQAFSQPQASTRSANQQNLAVDTNQLPTVPIEVKQATLVPFEGTIVSETPPPIEVSSVMTTSQFPTQVVPTAEPVAESPALASLATDETALFSTDFSTANLVDWQYDTLFWDPQPAPAWYIKNDQYAQGVLAAPENREAITSLNDTMAFPPVMLTGDGGIEVSARAGSAEYVGLVMGDRAAQNYVVMLLGTSAAYGIGSPGLNAVHLSDNTPRFLIQEPKAVIANKQWYRLKMELVDGIVTMQVENGEAYTLPVPDGLDIQHVGVYAGSGGYAYFDHLRVFGTEEEQQ